MKLEGIFQNIDGEEITTLQSGDVIAFNSDPAINRIAFIRPTANIHYGIRRIINDNEDHPRDGISLLSKLFVEDLWSIIMLLSAATGLSAEQIDDYPSYEWAFRFVKK